MRKKRFLKALAIEILVLAGLLVFARGFLPPTRLRMGYASDLSNVPAKFNRIVFMVVDAMRSDFIFSESMSEMKNVHELLRAGKGYAFTAFSDPPTVTLPRLKGLTTGASPNFLDAVINVAESDSASTLQNQDSWIYQFKAQGKRLHMFGDDTWLKLFPDVFDKYEGTSSFYVADFTEVDNNVTRHLSDELSQKTHEPRWDALILHYLGLDHIGHKSGPYSTHMPGKQVEMDDIVRKIYDSLDDDTLLVVAGDHGMNEVGNHGGASSGETSAALALFSPTFSHPLVAPASHVQDFSYYTRVLQVDIVPTLATLFGFPIPKNSLGVFIEELLPLWASPEEKKAVMEANCRQLELLPSSDAQVCNWNSLRKQQQLLMRTSSEHIVPFMIAGLLILVCSAVLCFSVAYFDTRLDTKRFTHRDKVLAFWWLIVPVVYFMSMLGSSTVEEEHYLWYWITSGILLSLLISVREQRSKFKVILMFACFRVIRGWKSAGQKWSTLSDTSQFLIAHHNIQWVLIVLTFAFVCFGYTQRKAYYRSAITVLASVVTLTLKYQSAHHPLSLPWMVQLARSAFALCALDGLLGGGLETALPLVLIVQTKLETIPIWPALMVGRRALCSLRNAKDFKAPIGLTPDGIDLVCALLTMCLEYASFFAIGGSNSLATIDLSNAYNGVSGYNIPLVALLTYAGNWSTSIYWATALPKSAPSKLLRAWFYSVACTGVALACFVLRDHLFIWTVFSPKLLYVGAWLLFHEIIVTSFLSFC